jgi:hypothetical protein
MGLSPVCRRRPVFADGPIAFRSGTRTDVNALGASRMHGIILPLNKSTSKSNLAGSAARRLVGATGRSSGRRAEQHGQHPGAAVLAGRHDRSGRRTGCAEDRIPRLCRADSGHGETPVEVKKARRADGTVSERETASGVDSHERGVVFRWIHPSSCGQLRLAVSRSLPAPCAQRPSLTLPALVTHRR